MTTFCWRVVGFVAGTLEPAEREAVLGDLVEQDEPLRALRDVVGLVARRQTALWMDWRPWFVLVAIALPFAVLLSVMARFAGDMSVQVLWNYQYQWQWHLVGLDHFALDVVKILGTIPLSLFRLVCWSWSLGLLLGLASRRTLVSMAAVFGVALIVAEFVGVPLVAGAYIRNLSHMKIHSATPWQGIVIQLILVLLPALAGIRQAQRFIGLRTRLRDILLLIALIPVVSTLLQTLAYWFFHAIPDWRGPGVYLVQLAGYWPVLYWLRLAWHRIGKAARRSTEDASLPHVAD